MGIDWLWARVSSILGSRKWTANTQLYTAKKLRDILRRQRSLADRNHHQFSLLVFEPHGLKNGAPSAAPLVRVLQGRLRSTDEIGWFDRRRIGVVLPHTCGQGAFKVAQDVAASLAESGPAPRFTIYTYPLRTPDDNGRHNGGGNRRATDASFAAPPAAVGGPSSLAGIGGPSLSSAVEVRGLESILLQPSPPLKRVLDLAGGLAALLVLSPLMLAAAVLVKLSSPGPVIFKQPRAGLGGKPFTVYKFRTMIEGADSMKCGLLDQNEQTGPVFKMKNDPRITPLGRLLRRTSIDELPQLWNVVKGDMSLVGPRPPTLDEVPQYDAWQRRRLDVKPGLTCIWQVSGRSTIGFVDWVRMDVSYIHRRSSLLDLSLLIRTLPAVISRKGAL